MVEYMKEGPGLAQGRLGRHREELADVLATRMQRRCTEEGAAAKWPLPACSRQGRMTRRERDDRRSVEGARRLEAARLSGAASSCASSSPWSSSLIAGWLFSVLFAFLRSRDANRFLVVLVAIGVGSRRRLPPVLGDGQGRRLAPGGFREGCGPTSSSAQPLVILSVFLVYPVFNTILISFKDARWAELRRAGQLSIRLHRPQHAHRHPQHRGLDRPRSARRSEHRPRLRDARRSAPSRRGDRQVA